MVGVLHQLCAFVVFIVPQSMCSSQWKSGGKAISAGDDIGQHPFDSNLCLVSLSESLQQIAWMLAEGME